MATSSLHYHTITGGVRAQRLLIAAPVECKTKYPKHWRHKWGAPTKRWVKYPVDKATGKFIEQPVHIEPGDMVMIIAGKDEGKTGKVQMVDRVHLHCKVWGCNKRLRHIKYPKQKTKHVWKEGFLPVASTMLYSEKYQKASDFKYETLDNGVQVRRLVETNEIVYPKWYRQRCAVLGYYPDGTLMPLTKRYKLLPEWMQLKEEAINDSLGLGPKGDKNLAPVQD